MTRRVRPAGSYFTPELPPGALYVGRPAPYLPGSIYQNPYPVRKFGLDESRRLFRERLVRLPDYVQRAREELAGRDLACWCRLEAAGCHADDWLALANGWQLDGDRGGRSGGDSGAMRRGPLDLPGSPGSSWEAEGGTGRWT